MSKSRLPENILSLIITQYLLDSDLFDCLKLRTVNRWVNDEVLCQLFYIQIKDLCSVVRGKGLPQHLAILHLQGFFAKHKVKPKSHARFRKAILRAAGHDPLKYDDVRNSCFCCHPNQQCLREVVGCSTSSNCTEHTMLSTVAVTFGSLVVGFGRNDTLGGFNLEIMREPAYWSTLVACYSNKVTSLRSMLQELSTNDTIRKDDLATLICACFIIAVRQDMPDMIDLLHEEAKELEDLPAKLGRMSHANSLLDSIRLGHCEVMRRLLKWQWKFNHDTMSYMNHVRLIIDESHLPERKVAVQTEMLQVLFDWTDTWRNIYEMKQFLINVGVANQQHFLQVAVDMLKSQHFFRHERGAEGNFSTAEPLASLATHGNLELLKLYLDNEKLLLPHTDAAQSKEMRRALLESELENGADARIDLMKLVMDFSQDLLESKTELQKILIYRFDVKLECWAWLAKMIGLDSYCADWPRHTLGSVMLEKAVGNLCVETIRFLVNNGCQLIKSAMTPQVYEDDEEAMLKLSTIKRLLTSARQGAFEERKVVETTFLPHAIAKTTPTPTKRLQISKSSPTTRVTAVHGPSSGTSASSKPSSLRKSLAQTARKHMTRRSKKQLSTSSVSSAGSDVAENLSSLSKVT